MNDRTKLGLGILAVAAIMGMLGDALLRETPWGLNVLVWMVVMVAAVSTLSRFVGMELPGRSLWLALALIVRTNAGRAKSGRGFDARYATSLSADAVPALVDALPALSTQERSAVASRLLTRWTPLEHEDWRSASWSRREAWRAIQQNGSTLWSTAVWQENERSENSR